ncbi:MAG: hypothetical protein JRM94_03210 [Nitrososphaerota archaeon]|nr:hypothetical protein [Nitrososphaerota archaeon]
MARYHWSLKQVGVVLFVLLVAGALLPFFPAGSVLLFFAFAIGLVVYGVKDARSKGLQPSTRLPRTTSSPTLPATREPTPEEVKQREEANRRNEAGSLGVYKREARIAKAVVIVGILLGIIAISLDVQMTSSAISTGTNPPSAGAILVNSGILLTIASPILGVSIHESAKRKLNLLRKAIAEMCPRCKAWSARLLVGKEELGGTESWETVYDAVQTTTRIRNPDGSYSDAASTTTQPRTARVGYTNYLDEYACRFCGFKWKEPSMGRFVR